MEKSVKSAMHDVVAEAAKASPAAASWWAWSVTAESIYKWIGLIYLVLLLLYLVRKWWREEAEWLRKARDKVVSKRLRSRSRVKLDQ